MKKLHKISAIVVGASMTLSLAAFANDGDIMLISEENKDLVSNIQQQLSTTFSVTSGTVEELSEDGSQITIKTETGIYDSLIANVGSHTAYITADGDIIGYDSLKKGDKVVLYHSNAVTMSIPAQSPTYAVVVNNDDSATPKYMEIGEVKKDGDNYVVTSKDRLYEITVNAKTDVSPYKTRNIIKPADLKQGDEILVWYGRSTRSIPEMATADKVIVAATYVEGFEADFDAVEIGGVSMVPLRAAANKLGADVDWDSDTNTAIVILDDTTYKIQIDNNNIDINDKIVLADNAAVLHNDKTMIDVSLFENLFNTTILF